MQGFKMSNARDILEYVEEGRLAGVWSDVDENFSNSGKEAFTMGNIISQ